MKSFKKKKQTQILSIQKITLNVKRAFTKYYFKFIWPPDYTAKLADWH